MAVDKNKAFVDYLLQCPQIRNTPLYFNFINAKDNTTQIVTSASDMNISRPFVDGSVQKRYTYTIVTFKSITDIPLAKVTTVGTSEVLSNENIDELADIQALIDWIAEQQDAHNYPNFGDNCLIDEVSTTTDAPRFDGVNNELSPAMAMYSIDIIIDYVDTSRVIWNK